MQTIKYKTTLLKGLLYLKDIMDTGRMCQTATRNGIKQSNLSGLITELEQELKTTLIYRSPKGTYPTNSAHQLYDDIAEIERILGHIQTSFSNKDELNGTITVWSEAVFLNTYIFAALSDFYAQYPKIRLDILTSRTVNLSYVDVAIVHNYSENIPSGRTLFQTNVNSHFYTTKQYLDAVGEPKNLDDLLENFDLCLWQPALLWPECRIINKKARHLNTTSDLISTSLNLIKLGKGISLLPDWCTLMNPDLIKLDSLNFEIKHTFKGICRQGFENEPKIKAFSNLINDMLKKMNCK